MPRKETSSQSPSSQHTTHDAQSASHCFASDRLRIRTGRLARSEREDHAAALDAREPEELFEPLGQEIE